MPVTVATSDNDRATAETNQKKIDRCQNGVLWAMFHGPSGGSSTNALFRYSTNNGATWVTPTVGAQLPGATVNTLTPYSGSLFIDENDFAHVVVNDRNDGQLLYYRGTPDTARTQYTWTNATVIKNTASQIADIVAHPEGSGWRAHIVLSVFAETSSIEYYMVRITGGGAITVDPPITYSTPGTPVDSPYASIDFHHNGNGKTVLGGTPHLFIAWSAGVAGAGNGIRFVKGTYSAGAWSFGANREIDTSRFVSTSFHWLSCLFDGTRVLIAGFLRVSTEDDLVLYERDVADTATVTRDLILNAGINDKFFSGSFSYDINGDVHIVGRDDSGAIGSRILRKRRWIRSSGLLEAATVIDNTATDHTRAVCKRGHAGNRVELVYTDNAGAPFNITHEAFSINSTPNVPTALTVTSDVLDNTPNFSADISDPDTAQQIKGRFQIYQNDGVTLVGTVDSLLRTGAGNVTAEFATALPPGNYRVQAATVDDLNAISAYTAQVSFQVKVSVEKNSQYIWNVDALITKDSQLIWDVLVANQKDITLRWDITSSVEKSFQLQWNQNTPWLFVPADPLNNPVTWEKVSP